MPRMRSIQTKLIDDERVNRLPVECRYLFDRLLLSTDCDGRVKAEPRIVNHRYFPFDDYPDEQIDEWLAVLHKAKKSGKGLIEVYEVDGIRYLWLPGFMGEQSKTWVNWIKGNEAPSHIPPPPTTKERREAGIKDGTHKQAVAGTKAEVEDLRNSPL